MGTLNRDDDESSAVAAAGGGAVHLEHRMRSHFDFGAVRFQESSKYVRSVDQGVGRTGPPHHAHHQLRRQRLAPAEQRHSDRNGRAEDRSAMFGDVFQKAIGKGGGVLAGLSNAVNIFNMMGQMQQSASTGADEDFSFRYGDGAL